MAKQNAEDIKGTVAETNEVPVMNADIDEPVVVEAKTLEVKNEDESSAGSDDEVSDDSELKFTRKTVEGLGKAVHLVDSDEDNGLDLFCYVKCSNTDSDLLKRCRGVAFHKDDLVLQAFPYTAEFNGDELSLLEDELRDFSHFRFFDSYEGALLRVFNFNGKWFLSTHRKLNAFRSKWASRDSFGTHFKKALNAELERNKKLRGAVPNGDNVLERFYSVLDEKKQYMFLVLNGSDNRIVCSPPESPTLFHVGTFIDGELDLDDEFLIAKPKEHHWLNIDEMVGYVKAVDPYHLQGIICFGPDNTQVKVFHPDYQDLFRARGNEPSIKFRYLQVRMNKRFTDMLYHLYPDQAEVFDDYEDTLFDVARTIYRSYVQRFIKKNYVTVPREEFQVIKACHDWHLADRTENRISLDKVISVLNKQPPTGLNRMIRRFKTEQAKKKEQQGELRFPRAHRGSRGDSVQNSPAVTATDGTPVASPLLLAKTGANLPPPPVLNV
jgi:hypothetical protein